MLIGQARAGNREAFGELVRLHRARAMRWAVSISHDQHLAEDIVQEALIRAFLKLGSLMDVERFVPWLERIVRNEAYMKLRRGGPFRKELPMSGSANAGLPDSLSSLAELLEGKRAETSDPLEQVMKQENMEMIQTLPSQKSAKSLNVSFLRSLHPWRSPASSPSPKTGFTLPCTVPSESCCKSTCACMSGHT
nr:RNA polymerase sigma factor [Paenactinomyces guangxiensis]